MGGCGGANGPVEPIGFFARVHQVDPPQLLRDLNDYAAGRTTNGIAAEGYVAVG